MVPDLRRLSLRNAIGVSTKGGMSAIALLADETLRCGAPTSPFNSAGTGQKARQFVLHIANLFIEKLWLQSSQFGFLTKWVDKLLNSESHYIRRHKFLTKYLR